MRILAFAARLLASKSVAVSEVSSHDHQIAARTLAMRGVEKRKAMAAAKRRAVHRELCEITGKTIPPMWRG